MTRKLPKVPSAFKNDGLAFENLRAFFDADNYVISRIEEPLSGREWGIDWSVEKLVEGHNTGVTFFVQSKVTSHGAKDGFFRIKLEVSTVNYLISKPSPVILHLYHQPGNKGYWLWFQNWYYQFMTSAKQKQETITVKIPVSNELSEKSVTYIDQIVAEEYTRQQIRQGIDQFNRINPDASYSEPSVDGNNIVLFGSFKNQQASFTFTFDDKGYEAVRRFHEEGYPVQFPIISSTVPTPMLSIAEDVLGQYVWLIPKVPSQQVVARILFVDAGGSELLKTSPVIFNLTRSGAKQQEWIGRSTDSVIYKIEFQMASESTIEDVRFAHEPSDAFDPISVMRYCEICEIWGLSKRVLIDNLQNEKASLEFEVEAAPQLEDRYLRIVRAAHSLKTNHGFDLRLPGKFDDEALFRYEMADDLLSRGQSFWKLDPIPEVYTVARSELSSIIDSMTKNGFIYITSKDFVPIQIPIGEIEIDLGVVRTVFCVTQFNNLLHLREELTSGAVGDLIEVELEVNLEKSFTVRA